MRRFTLACLLLGTVCTFAVSQPTKQPAGGKHIPTLVTWQGEIKPELAKEQPLRGFITDTATWTKLWKAWRGSEAVPEINFGQTIILVTISNDLNKKFMLATLDDRGNLERSYTQTLVRYQEPTNRWYQFALISREGIRRTDGKMVD